MTDERELLANKVKKFRNDENLNQFDFAEDCGISKDTVSLIERGQSNVRLDTVQLLASRMGVTVSELFQHSPVEYIALPGQVEIEGEIYKTYGIGILKNHELIDQVPDISPSRNKVKSLAILLNEENLSPIHLHDIAEDAIL